jgi:amidohydrolase
MPSADLEMLKRVACEAIDARRDELIELSLALHRNPELKFEEHRAAAALTGFLRSQGYAVEQPAYGLATAFRATRGSGRPAVAILCEYDALPAVGHACGHNVIGAAGAGAAAGLARVPGCPGAVVVLGTPGEEGGGGKILMSRAGAFGGLDAAMMIHPAGRELSGMPSLAVCQLIVEYRGNAAHASAAPYLGINALDALVTAYSAVAQLRQHIRPSERIHGVITDGGRVPNIVPDRAAGWFYVRAANSEQLHALRERVMGCFRAGADATGAELSVRRPTPEYAELAVNPPLVAAYVKNLARLGRVPDAADDYPPIVASTDMGNVSHELPSLHPMIAIAPAGVPLHSTEFAEYAASESGHRGVIDGAKALAMTALDVLADEQLRAAMQTDFHKTRSSVSPDR